MKKLIYSLPVFLFLSLAQAAYEDHFPTYFEYCSGSQWKLQSGDEGGPAGHGFTYIHGLCKDYRSAYPQVIPCSEVSEEMKSKHPHDGVGISLDKNFSNVMWVAVPGRDMTLNGGVERKAITYNDIAAHITKINELKVFEGVVTKSNKEKGIPFGTPEYLEAVALDTLGTDHAVNWARGLHCVKIPAPKEKLPAVAQFLNESNNQYKDGLREYEWSVLKNNCIHLSVNQGEALAINKGKKVDQSTIKAVFNLAIPANTFLMYADQAVLSKMPSIRTLEKNLPKKGFYPTQVGSIMAAYPVYPSGDHFNTENLKATRVPRLLKYWKIFSSPKSYEKKYMTPERTNLKENAGLWIKRYEQLLGKLGHKKKGSLVEDYLEKQLELSKSIYYAE